MREVHCCAWCPFELTCQQAARSIDVGIGLSSIHITFSCMNRCVPCYWLCHFGITLFSLAVLAMPYSLAGGTIFRFPSGFCSVPYWKRFYSSRARQMKGRAFWAQWSICKALWLGDHEEQSKLAKDDWARIAWEAGVLVTCRAIKFQCCGTSMHNHAFHIHKTMLQIMRATSGTLVSRWRVIVGRGRAMEPQQRRLCACGYQCQRIDPISDNTTRMMNSTREIARHHCYKCSENPTMK